MSASPPPSPARTASARPSPARSSCPRLPPRQPPSPPPPSRPSPARTASLRPTPSRRPLFPPPTSRLSPARTPSLRPTPSDRPFFPPPTRPTRRALPSLALAVTALGLPASSLPDGRPSALDGPHPLLLADARSVRTAEDYDVDATTGYRMERYRAPVPDSVPGGTTLDTATLRERLAAATLVLVDVFPPKGLGADPLDGSWVVSEAHATLPGATWLPEVGRGYLTAEHEDYFRRNLERLSGGDPAAPLTFFCTADCWQSWNAARRAARWGYTDVHWYPLGTDGWQEEGGALVPARPVNFFDDSLPDEPPGPAASETVP